MIRFIKRGWLLLIGVLGGCGGPLYTVSDNPNSGIGFYEYEAIYTKTAVYEQSWTEFEVTATWGPDTENAPHKTVHRTYVSSAKCAGTIAASFAQAPTVEDGFNAIRQQLMSPTPKKLHGMDCEGTEFSLTPPPLLNFSAINSHNPELALRSVTFDRKHVPALTPRYINVNRPAMGQASATITLNQNGTLASAAGEVAGDVASKVFDLISKVVEKLPIQEAVSSVLRLEGDTKKESIAANKVPRLLALKVTPVSRLYSVTVKCGSCSGLPSANDSTAQLTIVEKRLDKQEDKTAEGKQFKFSGAVEMPKENMKGEKKE